MSFIFDFLSNKNTWDFAKAIVDTILRKRNLTLTNNEIVQLAQEYSYELFLEKNRAYIISGRYPMV